MHHIILKKKICWHNSPRPTAGVLLAGSYPSYISDSILIPLDPQQYDRRIAKCTYSSPCSCYSCSSTTYTWRPLQTPQVKPPALVLLPQHNLLKINTELKTSLIPSPRACPGNKANWSRRHSCKYSQVTGTNAAKLSSKHR